MGASVLCPEGHSNPSGQRFCGQCGSALVGLCANGHRNPQDQKFCGECGASLLLAVPKASGSKQPEVPQRSFSKSGAQSGETAGTAARPLWAAGAAERASREESSGEKPLRSNDADVRPSVSNEQLARNEHEGVSDIFKRNAAKASSSWLFAVWPVVVLLVILAVTLATCDLGNKPSKKAGGGQPASSGTGYSGSLFDDWIPAVCQPGTYFDSSNALLPNATADATCKSARGNPILMGQFTEEFTAKNAVAMFRGAEYAVAAPATGGVVQVFLSPTAKNALAPLRSFGFVIMTVPRG
jgi:hypothetical protein